MANKKESLAPRANVALDRPSFIVSGQQGLETLDQRDVMMPRLALCQAMSPQRAKSDSSYIPNLEEGMFFNTVTGKIYGDDPLTVTPLVVYKSRLNFIPMDDGGGLKCQGFTDGEGGIHCQINKGGPCLEGDWGLDGAKPACTLLYNYLVAIHGEPLEPVVLSMKSASTKAARQWNSLLRLRDAPSYAGVYEVSPTEEKNKAGKPYYGFKVVNAGWVADPDLLDAFKALYEQYSKMQIVTDVKGMDVENNEEM